MKNRRDLLAASAALAAGAGAAGLASCGGDSDADRAETQDTIEMQDDAAVLAALLELEQSAIVAYETVGDRLGEPFAEHEREHAGALRRMIEDLGGRPPPPRPADEYRAMFPPLRSERDALEFALDIETTAIGAYGESLGKVVTEAVRVTLGAILAVESEHAAVLLGRLGRPRVPDAFVTGAPPPASG